MIEDEVAAAFLMQDELNYDRLSTVTGTLAGFPPASAGTFTHLERELRRTNPAHAHDVAVPSTACFFQAVIIV